MDTLPLRKRRRLRAGIQVEQVVAVEPPQQEVADVEPPQQQQVAAVEPQLQEVVAVEPPQEEEAAVEPQLQEEVVVEPQQEGEELPERYRKKIAKMGGTKVRLVYKKKLTVTDAKGSQAHLAIPISALTHNFLTPAEKEKVENRIKGDREGGLTVSVIDPNLEEWELKLRDKSDTIYSLAYKWAQVLKANGLKADDSVQLWSFRSKQKLCLAIVKS